MSIDHASEAWTQGSVLDGAVVESFIDDGHLGAEWRGDWAVVVSHPCDLAHEDLDAEPTAEVLRAKAVASQDADGNFSWGKNPRRLQISSTNGDVLDISIHDRASVPRGVLLQSPPDAQRKLAARERELLATWLGKRYSRQAFPDEFNARVDPVRTAIRKRLKRGALDVGGLYIILSSDEELTGDAVYDLSLRGVMQVEAHGDIGRRTTAYEALQDVVGLLGRARGISVDTWDLVSEAEMTLDDLNFYRRWDYYDDLSHRSDDAAIAPDA